MSSGRNIERVIFMMWDWGMQDGDGRAWLVLALLAGALILMVGLMIAVGRGAAATPGRRPVVATSAVAVLLVAVAAVTVATALPGERPGRSGFGMPGSTADRMMGTRIDDEFGYLREMVAHHKEAVESAKELRRSKRPELRAFADSIISSQSAQIKQMNGWMAAWYPGRSREASYDPMMRDLSGLTGDDLDRAFLTDMTVHHMTAVMMSQHLLARGLADHAQVNTLARTIRDEQHAEIVQMRGWQEAWFDGPGRGQDGHMRSIL